MTGPALHWEEHPGRGPHALLVHGVLSGRAQWSPNLAALAGVCRPVVVELLGHGRSPSPAEDTLYRPEGYVQLFEKVRRSVGADRWFLVGQSLGAALTLRYALERPDRVIAQVFTNSSSAFAGDEAAGRMAHGALRLAERIEQEGRAVIESLPIHPARGRRLPPAVREALVEDARLHDPEGIARTFRFTVPESPVRQRASELRLPTLLVCGTRESGFTAARAFAEASIRGIEVVNADAGHAVNLEAPEAFDAAVAAFFGRHPTGMRR